MRSDKKMFAKITLVMVISCVISGCGSNNSKNSTVNATSSPLPMSYNIPVTCELPDVNAAFAKIIPTSRYIVTKWQPAPGTDLYSAINGGGIACSYGDQEAEVGGTILWVKNKDGLWDSRVVQWQKDGMVAVDIPGVDETAAYKLPEGATSADNLPAWRVNLLIGDLWIQLGAAFIQSWDEATPIINAAIAAAK